MAAEGLDGLVEQGVDGCHVLHGGMVTAGVVAGVSLSEVGAELVEPVDVGRSARLAEFWQKVASCER